MLDHPVDIKDFLYIKLNKSNIFQKQISILLVSQTQIFLLIFEELITKATLIDGQEQIALSVKNP